jgi:hypothetical protein
MPIVKEMGLLETYKKWKDSLSFGESNEISTGYYERSNPYKAKGDVDYDSDVDPDMNSL